MLKSVLNLSYFWAALGAVLYSLCFPNWNFYYLSPLVLPCYLFAIYRMKSYREALALALLVGVIFSTLTCPWIIYALRGFAELHLASALMIFFLFCFLAAPQCTIFFGLALMLRDHLEKFPHLLRPLIWTLLYISLEFIFHFIKIFPEHLGNSLVHYLPLAQAASLGGESLLSFFPLFVGASSYYFYRDRLLALPSLLLSIAIVIGFINWGKQQINLENARIGKTIRISILQGNIPDFKKIKSEQGNREALSFVIERYLSMANSAEKSDLLIWPETAYPMALRGVVDPPPFDLQYAERVMMRAKELHSSFFLGGYEREAGHEYNAGILIDEEGKAQASYRKSHLLILGEYVPFSAQLPFLKKIFPNAANFAIGEGPIPLLWHHSENIIKIGANICYEDIIPEFMHALAMRGADFFLNISNDSWFGLSSEPWQHLLSARLRSIENRIPLVRATNTGISVIVNSAGEITKMGPSFQSAILSGDIRLSVPQNPSFYRRYGEVFAWICVLLSLAFCLWVICI